MKKAMFVLMSILFLLGCQKHPQINEHGKLVPKTVVEDETIPSILIDGVKLHSESFGNPDHPMLVVLHGGPGGDYRGVLNFKAFTNDSLFVVFYDQRGSGLSERLSSSGYPSVQVYIDELAGVIDYYRKDSDQKIILAGHSWGAMLAAAYVNQNPEAVHGTIFIEPGGFTWEQTEIYIKKTRAINPLDEESNDFFYQDRFITGEEHNVLDYKLLLSSAGDIQTGDESLAPYWRYGAVCNSASIQLAINNPEQTDFTTNLKAYTKPSLFVFSELNKAYGEEHAKNVSSALSVVTLIEISGTGHEIVHFGWDQLYPVIKTYLTQIL